MPTNERHDLNATGTAAGRSDRDAPEVSGPTLAIPIARLVAQYLVGRVDGLPAPQVAAFVSGWTSALELVRRTELTLPDAPDVTREEIARLCGAIEQAQRTVLADPDA
jgi:hypothetical protein